MVYTWEGHPRWQLSCPVGGPSDGVWLRRSLDDWRRWARAREADLGLDLPLLVDSPDGREARRWGALPTRVFGIDVNGRVTYRGLGPAELAAESGEQFAPLKRWLEKMAPPRPLRSARPPLPR
jgi:hypothetical protein